MSKSSHKARPGSVAADPDVKVRPYKKPHPSFGTVNPNAPVEPLEADWAEHALSGCRTIVRRSSVKGHRRTDIWQAEDGTWYRNGGSIYLREIDGEYYFKIRLRRGANEDDLRFLRQIIDKAQGGALLRHGWKQFTDDNGKLGWAYTFSRWYLSGEETDLLYTTRDASPQLIVCSDSRCPADVHRAAGDAHVIDTITAKHYEISVERFVDRDGEAADYCVSVTAESELAPSQAASFASDLQWMAETCRKANDTLPDPLAKGLRSRRASSMSLTEELQQIVNSTPGVHTNAEAAR